MAEAAERVKAAAEQQGVEVVLEEPDPPVAVLGDRRQLTSAVYNLLENAVKFSYDNTVVTCAGHLDGEGEVVVEVTDKGLGIPPRPAPDLRALLPGDHGRGRSSGGTGLGLAIVRHVAANHRGSVHVESREGEGSTFSLRLPLQPGNEP